jgi:RNA polymerase sigma-70 factor (ECF subfamily)
MPHPPNFRSVYDEYFDFVWSCTWRFGVPADAMDDVVQEIFIVVHARLQTLEPTASPRSWLYGIVRRTVSTYRRSRTLREGREASEPTVDQWASPHERSPLDFAVVNDDLKLLQRLLSELDASKLEVLVLAEIEEMTVPEIARALEIPLNTAYSRLRLARQEFNEALSRHRAQQRTRGRHA